MHDHHELAGDPGRRQRDQRWLLAALALITGFIAVEIVVGVAAGSLALITDAAHMLTDAAAIALAMIAMRLAATPARGSYTYGLRRAEILSAQANGLTLLLLGGWLGYEAIRRLLAPSAVSGLPVLLTALAGVIVNLAATWALSRADRSSLNIKGAFLHILNDLYAFLATAVAGAVVAVTGFVRADAVASLIVVGLMIRAGAGLLRESGRILLEAAPAGVDPDEIAEVMLATRSVVEIHDLHVWLITSGHPALSAHVLVAPEADCHATRLALEALLRRRYRITHTTLQVDHVGERLHQIARRPNRAS